MFYKRSISAYLIGLFVVLAVARFASGIIITQNYVHTDSLRFFAIGDWGGQSFSPYYTNVEKAVANEMGKLADSREPQFILALGDNFYTLGVQNVDDKRFKETFEDVFSAHSLYIPWYFCAGNHDHHGNVSAEIEYSKKSSRWNFPDYNYTKMWKIPGTSSTVQLVMIDTVILCGITDDSIHDQPRGSDTPQKAEQQWAWIEETLDKSTSDYLLVAGHYPVWSIAEHGPTKCLVDRLKPLLEKYHVTAYICGHDHNLQHLDDGSGVHYIVTGCSNFVNNSNVHVKDVPRNSSKFFWANYSKLGGFATFYVTQSIMDMTFVDSTGESLYSIALKPKNIFA